MKLVRGVAGGLLVLFLAAACGEEDETLSKAEYVRQANSICAAGQQDFDRLFETDFPATREQLPAFFQKAAPIGKKQMSDLRGLEAPEGDEREVEAMLRAGDRAVADFERATTDVAFGARLFQQEGGKNIEDFENKAAAYGLTRCREDEQEGAERVPVAELPAERRRFLVQADAVCRRGSEQIRALEGQYLRTFPPPLEGWARFLPRVAPIERATLADLRELAPPPADRARIEDLWTRRQATIEKIERAGRLAATRQEQAFERAVQDLFQSFESIDQEMRSYGFQVCGSEDEEQE
ncbi:MAG: hypothetical protein M3198_10240 [Actinomycetota bacterium]|nr:hypothetical protein [Actinomycetota bacterium]